MPFNEMLEKLDERQKNLITLLVVILFIFLIGHKLIYKTAVKKVGYYNSKYQEEAAKNKLRQEINELSKAKEKYEKLVIQNQDLSGIKREISNLASSSGLRIISLDSSDREKKYNYNVASTTLRVQGTYHNIGNFASKIESKKPYMKVQNLNVDNTLEMRGPNFEAEQPRISPVHTKNILTKDTVVEALIVIETYAPRK